MYPLALSVVNDAASYEARKHSARKYLEGFYDLNEYRRDIRAICALKARDERATMGVKIKPAEITAQAIEVAESMLIQERDTIAANYTGTQCLARIRRWFDKKNGSSYFVVWLKIPQTNGGFATVKVPFQYGYGSHPEWTACRALKDLGLFPELAEDAPRFFPVDFEDQGYMPRRTL